MLGAIIRYKNKLVKRGGVFLNRTFFEKKLNNWFGILCLAGLSVIFGYLLATSPLTGIALFGLILAVVVLVFCLTSAEMGLYILTGYSFFAFFISRLLFGGNMTVGVPYDVITLATFLGVLVQRQADLKGEFNKFVRTPLVIVVLMMLLYQGVEIFNPNSLSLDTNMLAFRKFLGYVLLLFTCYLVFDSYEKVRRWIFFLFLLCTASALYGCIQQWHGYFNFEMQEILSDPHGFGLIYINGEFRKFGTMSDPAAFGIIMSAGAVFFLVLATREKKRLYRQLFIAGSVLMILAMGYSGTRTANAVIVAGVGFFVALNFDKRTTRLLGIVSVLTFLILLYGPIHGNKTVDRFRTTFIGEDDPSFKVRVLSRHFVQPYILSHPLGGGLGSTGATGVATMHGHFLANFQPDSSYLKTAAEQGWIGLAILCTLYFVVLLTGIKGFFRTYDERIRIIYAATVTSVFAFYVAEYAQVALGQITDVVVYFPMLSVILKLKDDDPGFSPSDGSVF